jgi:hypothetical protein
MLLLFMETVVPLARKAPEAAAALNLRSNARSSGVAPILTPDGRPLPACRVPLPLDASGEQTLAAWAATAAASEWPTGRTIRAELLDGTGAAIRSEVLQPAVFGVAVDTAAAGEGAPRPADPPRPRLALDLGDGAAGLLGALFDALSESQRAVISGAESAHKTARELGGVLGRVAAAGTAQSGALASTVASAHAAQAEAAADALREARDARAEAAQATGAATAAETALELLQQGAAAAGGRGSGQLEIAARLLGPLLASATAGPPTAAPAPDAPAPGLPPGAAAAPPGGRLTELVRLANAGDADARAILRAAIEQTGGFAGLSWLATDG